MANSLNPSFVQQITNGIQESLVGAQTSNIARVTHVVYGPFILGTNIPDPYYKDPTSIGIITFQSIDGTEYRTSNSAGNPTAKPLNSNYKQIPVQSELVQIQRGPSVLMNEDREAPEFYYTTPYNLWNATHHNAFPDAGDYQQFSNNTQRGYEQSQFDNQPNNLSNTSSINFPLGPGIIEQSNAKSLRIFPGDVIVESRWGSSIRFGSTTPNSPDLNPWSTNPDSTPNNPITIIRNGQGPTLDTDGWIPTIENINRDPSSIYLTNGQQIIITDIQNNFSLASLQVSLQGVTQNSIPLQQQLTNIESVSSLQQDQDVAQEPTQEQVIEQVAQTEQAAIAQTPASTPIPIQTTPTPVVQETTNVRGTFIKDITNRANQTIELFYKKSGFSTTVFGYLKNSGKLIFTGQPSNSTSTPLDTLVREAELTTQDNVY